RLARLLNSRNTYGPRVNAAAVTGSAHLKRSPWPSERTTGTGGPRARVSAAAIRCAVRRACASWKAAERSGAAGLALAGAPGAGGVLSTALSSCGTGGTGGAASVVGAPVAGRNGVAAAGAGGFAGDAGAAGAAGAAGVKRTGAAVANCWAWVRTDSRASLSLGKGSAGPLAALRAARGRVPSAGGGARAAAAEDDGDASLDGAGDCSHGGVAAVSRRGGAGVLS